MWGATCRSWGGVIFCGCSAAPAAGVTQATWCEGRADGGRGIAGTLAHGGAGVTGLETSTRRLLGRSDDTVAAMAAAVRLRISAAVRATTSSSGTLGCASTDGEGPLRVVASRSARSACQHASISRCLRWGSTAMQASSQASNALGARSSQPSSAARADAGMRGAVLKISTNTEPGARP